jgi:hypothetical protein
VPGRSASHLGRSPVLHGTHRTPTYTQEMSNLFQTVLGFFAPKPIRTHVESMTTYRTIEAVNDCGEKALHSELRGLKETAVTRFGDSPYEVQKVNVLRRGRRSGI